MKRDLLGDYSSDADEVESLSYRKIKNPNIKLIDFGGATFRDQEHSRTINTRHYRSPEVILGF